MKFLTLSFLFTAGLFLFGCTNTENITTASVDQNKVLPNDSVLSGTYQLVSHQSVLHWKGSRPFSFHEGTVDLKNGAFVLSNGSIESGSFVIDMTTISSTDTEGAGKERLDGHLKSEDFFNVEVFGESTFEILSADKATGNEWNIQGDLTIKGESHPIEILATLTEEGDTLRVQAPLTIDRTLWAIQYGSGKFFQDLGDKVIKDEIEFTIDFVFQKAQ